MPGPLARSLALERVPVRVKVVSPGIIDTPIRAAMPQILAFMTIGFATGSVVYIDGGALIV